MCKQLVASFLACGHAIERAEFMIRCEWFVTISAHVYGIECPELRRTDSEFDGYCHQCLLTAIVSKNENRPPGPLLPAQRSSPEDRVGARRILDLCRSPVDRIYYDESTGRSYPYDGSNVGLFSGSGEVSVTDMYWLHTAISDVTAILWEQWESHELPDPTLHEMMLLIQMREALVVSQIACVNAAFVLLQQAMPMLQDSPSRANVLQRLPSILTSVEISELGNDGRNCIICQERFGEANEDLPAEFPYGLPCGHVVGSSCIRVWIEEAPNPLRICTLCNLSFGIVGYQAVEADDVTVLFHALVFAGVLPGPVPEPAPEFVSGDGILAFRPLADAMEAVRPDRPPVQSPYWMRLLRGDGSVFRATSHHHRFRSIRRRGR
jgi:hypothetical protein